MLWPRIDQKTCLKAITAAGLEAVPLPLLLEGDQLVTDVEGLRRRLEELGPDSVAAVVTTTSCFAPRAADDVVAVAKLCQAAGVGHVINNAYGVQARRRGGGRAVGDGFLPVCVEGRGLLPRWSAGHSARSMVTLSAAVYLPAAVAGAVRAGGVGVAQGAGGRGGAEHRQKLHGAGGGGHHRRAPRPDPAGGW